MAYIWVPNEVALEHNGVKIYHIYKNDDYEAGARMYWFGLDEYGSDDSDENSEHIAFDVRNLSTYEHGKDIYDVLREAIEKGDITQNNVKLLRSDA